MALSTKLKNLLVVIVVFGTILRVLASLDDFWLDEIWGWENIQQVSQASDIIFKLKHENNNILNSFWIYWAGPDANWRWYRFPAIVFGSFTIPLFLWSVSRKAIPFAVVLASTSYLLIQYSSEARGYAYLLFFQLAAFLILKDILENVYYPRRLFSEIVFAFACIMGALSHPMFLIVYGSLMLWTAVKLVCFGLSPNTKMPLIKQIITFIRIFIIPSTALFALWWINFSKMMNGGGPDYDYSVIMAATLSLMVGGPEYGVAAQWIAIFAIIMIGCELIMQIQERNDHVVLWLGWILGPTILMLILHRDEIYPRYFLVSVIGMIIVLSEFMVRVFNYGKFGKFIAITAMCAISFGNLYHDVDLIQNGRGHSFQVMKYLDEHTKSPIIAIETDWEFRHKRIFIYYGRWLTKLISNEDEELDKYPEWYLRHSFFKDTIPDERLTVGYEKMKLVKVFPYSGLSGWQTAVYHQVED